jgi:hypothetical protein
LDFKPCGARVLCGYLPDLSLNIEKLSESAYKVQGEIIEVTGVEEGIAAKRPIILTAEKTEGHWLITGVNKGD